MSQETPFAPQPGERKLTLNELLHWLAQDGMVPPAETEKLARNRKADHSNLHPLVIIGEGEVTVATAEPFLTDWVADLERMLNLKIKLVLASPLDINHYLPEIYR